MQISVQKKYIVVPLGYHARTKKIVLSRNTSEGKEIVYDVDAAIDIVRPDYYGYLNVERFRGETLELECQPTIDYVFEMIDELPLNAFYEEKYRPAAHFSTRYGWINDPNGLIYDSETGLYHMFYQHNPVGHMWGNMHWGHALSKDLLHWEEVDEALYSDEFGTMFSGSAIKNKDGDLMLFYTAAGGNNLMSKGKRFTQCVAISKDGGKTFEKYGGNPILPHIDAENRDPKVIFCPEINAYVMALFLNGHEFALYKSDDLLQWTLLQKLTMPNDDECPDFYPLYVDGDPKQKKWIFSAAHDRYFVGEMIDGKFVPQQEEKRLHYGKNSYAAQSFSGLEGEDGVGRRVRIAWNTTHAPFEPFNCSMCIPTQMTLQTIDGELYLCSWPIEELATLYTDTKVYTDVKTIETALDGEAYDIELELQIQADSVATISLFGMEIRCSAKDNQITMDGANMPMYCKDGVLHLRLIVDKLGVEIYQDKGQAFMCNGFFCDYTLNQLTVQAAEGDLQIQSGKVHRLQNTLSL